jgi:hypothetical protein
MYFPFLFRNIPAVPTYRVYIFQLIFQSFPIKYRNQINKEKRANVEGAIRD